MAGTSDYANTLIASPGDNPEAIPVAARDDDGGSAGETTYEVDLRYYELRAERDLQRARDAATRQ